MKNGLSFLTNSNYEQIVFFFAFSQLGKSLKMFETEVVGTDEGNHYSF